MTQIFQGLINEDLHVTLGASEWDYNYKAYPSITLISYKDSVNDGSFIPGKYRVNPYSVYAEHQSSSDSGYNITWVRSDGAVYEHTVSGTGINMILSNFASSYKPSIDHSNYGKRAMQHAYSKLGRADLELGESIGELRQTIDMLKSPLRSLREFLSRNGARNANILNKLLVYAKTGTWIGVKDKVKAAKAAADTWLEFRYGFRPLILTIRDVVEKVNKADRKGFSPTTVRSRRTKLRKTFEEKSPEMMFLIAPNSGARMSVTYDIVQEYYAAVQYTMSRPPSMLEDYGLALPWLPETAWELSRLSFVVDWFIQIGPWLATHRYKPHVQVLGNTLGTKVTISAKCESVELWSKFDATRATLETLSAPDAWTLRSYDRIVNYDLPALPQFTGGDVVDLFRSIDSVALIIQRIQKFL